MRVLKGHNLQAEAALVKRQLLPKVIQFQDVVTAPMGTRTEVLHVAHHHETEGVRVDFHGHQADLAGRLDLPGCQDGECSVRVSQDLV